MIRRFTFVIAVCVSLSALSPVRASAHGPILHGYEIDSNTHVSLGVDYHVNAWKWLTVGLRPGKLTIHLTVNRCGRPIGPSCGLLLNLRNTQGSLRLAEAACYSTQRRCGKSTSLTFQVPSTGVYYIVIGAMGADNVTFTIDVRGNIYPLHCKKYC